MRALNILGPEVMISSTPNTVSDAILVRVQPSGAAQGNTVNFRKVDYSDPPQIDIIDTDVQITRGNNGAIYNPLFQTGWDNNGPTNTEWNSEGWGDLANVAGRSYTSFNSAVGGNIGINILNRQLVLHDTANDKYYKVQFVAWTQGGQGGGFAYIRQQILYPTSGFYIFDSTLVTHKSNGNTVGSFFIQPFECVYIRKGATDTLETLGSIVACCPVGFF